MPLSPSRVLLMCRLPRLLLKLYGRVLRALWPWFFFQVMVGAGKPVAWQLMVSDSPSPMVTVSWRVVIFGGTRNQTIRIMRSLSPEIPYLAYMYIHVASQHWPLWTSFKIHLRMFKEPQGQHYHFLISHGTVFLEVM